MEITEQSIIGEIVAKNYRTASIFKEYQIDFCCNGNRTIQAACTEKDLRSDVLIEKLEASLQNTRHSEIDFSTWPLDLVVDYIEKKHHRYVTDKILEIRPYLQKIVAVHGSQHPELNEIETLFHQSADDLTIHMKKEELILFPYIRKMSVNPTNTAQPPFGSVKNPIAMMHHDHDEEGERFRKISQLSQNYTPPANACNTYKTTFALLQEFEDDLHRHIHLENNILFPKAIELENRLANPNSIQTT